MSASDHSFAAQTQPYTRVKHRRADAKASIGRSLRPQRAIGMVRLLWLGRCRLSPKEAIRLELHWQQPHCSSFSATWLRLGISRNFMSARHPRDSHWFSATATEPLRLCRAGRSSTWLRLGDLRLISDCLSLGIIIVFDANTHGEAVVNTELKQQGRTGLQCGGLRRSGVDRVLLQHRLAMYQPYGRFGGLTARKFIWLWFACLTRADQGRT